MADVPERPLVVRPEPVGEVIMIELCLKRKRGALGVAIREDTLVTEIDAGSGGEESGMLAGDYVMELGDTAINNYAEMLPLLKSMSEAGIRALVRRPKPEEDPEAAAAKAAEAEAEETEREGRGVDVTSETPPAEEAPPAEADDPRRLAIEAALTGSAGRTAVEKEPKPSGLSGLLKQLSFNSTAALRSAIAPDGLVYCQARPARSLTANGLPPKVEGPPRRRFD